MSDKPRLSFVIPVYRPRPEWLEKCAKALRVQSLLEWEAVIVLDGPDPVARQRLETAFHGCHQKVKIIEIDHGGAPRARNAGYAESAADVVCFWDVDCVIEPHAALAWMELLDDEPGVGFVYSGYRFEEGMGAISAEPFDPWTLRVRNYISTCFPVRRSLVPEGAWNETLASLQDWDFWLGVVERGGVGRYIQGYAFQTAFPDPESISGKGCTTEAWLGRLDAVRVLHDIPRRSTCVTSLGRKIDGVRLAKYLDADYVDVPNDRPHSYRTIIQLGFSLQPDMATVHAGIFRDPEVKKVLFWTQEDINEIYNAVSLKALDQYSALLNSMATQFCEDAAAQKILARAGFQVMILPVPEAPVESRPMPAKPRLLLDIQADYSVIFSCLEKSLPDVEFDILGGASKVEDYTGLIHFYTTRCMSPLMRRMLAQGRAVISNVQAPYAGYVSDRVDVDDFVPAMVEKIRAFLREGPSAGAAAHYGGELDKAKLLEVIA